MVDASREALSLWALQLVPSLLPYMIISTFTLHLLNRLISITPSHLEKICFKIFHLSFRGTFILFAGHLCGYPIGAKLVADAYTNNHISKQESNYLLSICNQSSPAFLQYYVGEYILQQCIPNHSIYILFYISTFMTSLFLRLLYPVKISNRSFERTEQNKKENLITVLDSHILNSCITILKVGGYVLLFSILSNFLLSKIHVSSGILHILLSSLEITTGLAFLKQNLIGASYYSYIVLLITAFGGFSTMAQIKGMLVGTSLSIKSYIIGKIIYTSILLILYALFSKINIFHFVFQ